MALLQFLPASVTKRWFGIGPISFNAGEVWDVFHKIAMGKSVSPAEWDLLGKYFIFVAVLVIKTKYPSQKVGMDSDGTITRNENQIEEVQLIVTKLFEYYMVDPHSRVLKKFPNRPSSPDEERQFLGHFKTKGGLVWTDGYRKRKKDVLKRVIAEANESFGDDEMTIQRRKAEWVEATTGRDTSADLIVSRPASGLWEVDLSDVFDEEAAQALRERGAEIVSEAYGHYLTVRVLREMSNRDLAKTVGDTLVAMGGDIEGREVLSADGRSRIDGIVSGPLSFGDEDERPVSRLAFEVTKAQPSAEKIARVLSAAAETECDHGLVVTTRAIDGSPKRLQAIVEQGDIGLSVWDVIGLADAIADHVDSLPPATWADLERRIGELIEDF